MKQCLKIYVEPEVKKKAIEKAKQCGFEGRGALSKYCKKVFTEPICFLDDNVMTLLQHMNPMSGT